MKLKRANRGASAAEAAPDVAKKATEAGAATAKNPAGVFDLVLHLAGRICLVKRGGDFTALFLDVQRNPALGFREHRPVLRAPLDDTRQSGADEASVSFVDADGRAHALWFLKGHHMEFEGLAPAAATPQVKLDSIVDLRAVYAPVNKKATWLTNMELLDGDAKKYGIAARLSLKGFDVIDSLFFDRGGELKEAGRKALLPQERVYIPGQHKQEAHSIIRCRAKYRGPDVGRPTLVLTPFDGGKPKRVAFDDATDLMMTFSNICTCVGIEPQIEHTTESGATLEVEDHEFAAYYELMAFPPPVTQRPVPFFPPEGAGGGGVPECIHPSQLPGTGP